MSVPSTRILLIHLGALGAVLRSTALLPAIRRKFPNAHITWVTSRPADQLLKNNSMIDRVFTTENSDLLAISALEFDIALCVDKSLEAAGVLKRTYADFIYGFAVVPATGSIVPATPAAEELWEIGLNDYKKFKENQKTENQLVTEALELPYSRDHYSVKFTDAEKAEIAIRKAAFSKGGKIVVGLNTGCAGVIPYKKMTIETHRKLIARLLEHENVSVVLLGGKEDTDRNQRIGYGFNVIQTPTESGLRDGLMSVAACDIVVSGDSLGMHMAIALNKWTVAWFGPTCSQEIDLYDRGVKILAQVSCGPCWKRSCNKTQMCYDMVSLEQLEEAVLHGVQVVTTENERLIDSPQVDVGL
jgi:heptosyltransferase II